MSTTTTEQPRRLSPEQRPEWKQMSTKRTGEPRRRRGPVDPHYSRPEWQRMAAMPSDD